MRTHRINRIKRGHCSCRVALLQTSDENDSMLGAIAADQAIGSAFASVASASAANTFDTVTRVLDTASSVYSDRCQKPFQIGQKNMIANDFNGNAKRSPQYQAMMKAYQRDLPQRLSLEKFCYEMRRLYALQKHAHMYMAVRYQCIFN